MKILSDPIKVSEIMKKILAPHGKKERESGEFTGSYNQTQAAEILGITQAMVSDWKHSGPGSDNQQSWRNWLALFTYCEEELGIDPRYPSESPKKEGKGMKLAEKTKGKRNNKGNEKL